MDFVERAMSFWKNAFHLTPNSVLAAGALALSPAIPLAADAYVRGPAFQAASSYATYRGKGGLSAFGFTAHAMNSAGGMDFEGWGRRITVGAVPEGVNRFGHTAEALATWGSAEKFLERGGPFGLVPKGIMARLPGLGGLANGFMAYQGYEENGWSGAYDAVSLNIGIEAALVKWGTGVGLAKVAGSSGFMNPATKLAGHSLSMSLSAGVFRGLGATAGGMIGQQLGLATGVPMMGTLGATAGAYVGAAPLAAMAANPILTTGAVLGLGAAVASYGAYQIVKSGAQAGYAHRQSQRGVNTDGDMSAFMTANAMTMRERSVQAIARSGMNGRSALGMEANFLHSPKNYNSRYR